MKDLTLQEKIETTLYTAGVQNSGEISQAIIEGVVEHLNELLDNASENGGGIHWGDAFIKNAHWDYELRDQFSQLNQ